MLECGTGHIDKAHNIVHLHMTRMPILGYTGYIVLSPIGAPPPVPQSAQFGSIRENIGEASQE
jgi:hypothetical protein